MQSPITVEPVMTSADEQAFKDDPQRVAARSLRGFAKRDTFALFSKARRPLPPLACSRNSANRTISVAAMQSPFKLFFGEQIKSSSANSAQMIAHI